MGSKVLVSDKLPQQGIDILKAGGIDVDFLPTIGKEELKAEIKNYEGLVIRSRTKVTSDVIEAAENLEIIGRAGIGVDNVDIPSASRRGIIVMNTPGGNVITTAEHAISLMLSLSRKIPQASHSLKEGRWEKSKFVGVEIFNKTLGVVGMGRIGSIVADRAQGLRMRVIAYDPFVSQDMASKIGVELVTFEELLARSDFISLHTPMSKETEGLINRETIEKMKDGVMIVNCARGGIVNDDALYEGIKSGKVRGAALDVYRVEPPQDRRLIELEEVICTPHLGASTGEAQLNVALAVAEQMADYFSKGIVRNGVNFPSVGKEILQQLQPYLNLAENLGIFQLHLFKGGIEEVIVEYCGDIIDYDLSFITSALLKGIMSSVEEGVNFINAPILAEERGIKVIETKKRESEVFMSLITLKTKTSLGENSITGTLFGKSEPRIVRINEFSVETVPNGNILVMLNDDKAGVIGNIGTILGDEGVNIGSMQFGRDKPGGRAISILHLDSPLTPGVMEKIKGLPNIISVTQIQL